MVLDVSYAMRALDVIVVMMFDGWYEYFPHTSTPVVAITRLTRLMID